MPLFAEPSPTPARNGPLHGLHVLDLSTVISGPMAVAVLADQARPRIWASMARRCWPSWGLMQRRWRGGWLRRR